MVFTELLSWWPLVVLLLLLVVGTREVVIWRRNRRALVERLRPTVPDWPSWRQQPTGEEVLQALVSDDAEIRSLAERVGTGAFPLARWVLLGIALQFLDDVTDLVHPFLLWATLLLVLVVWWYGAFRLEPLYRAASLELLRYWHRTMPAEWQGTAFRVRFGLDPFEECLAAARGSESPNVRKRADALRKHSRLAWVTMGPLLLVMLASFVIDIAWR